MDKESYQVARGITLITYIYIKRNVQRRNRIIFLCCPSKNVIIFCNKMENVFSGQLSGTYRYSDRIITCQEQLLRFTRVLCGAGRRIFKFWFCMSWEIMKTKNMRETFLLFHPLLTCYPCTCYPTAWSPCYQTCPTNPVWLWQSCLQI